MNRPTITRRALAQGTMATALLGASRAAQGAPEAPALGRSFVPFKNPGRVVRVDRSSSLQPNELWPKPEAARLMLQRAMEELTGKADVGEAFARFVHKDDIVAIKPNGIAGQKGATMASNKELILEVVLGVIAAGVPASRITIFEQYGKFLAGTRVVDEAQTLHPDFPVGIKTAIHQNKEATMDSIEVASKKTKFVTAFTDATCVINISQIKDHSICGFTGAMKNITHGSIINPHDYHAHNASPQIAQLYAQDVVKKRVVLHIADAFKVIYDEGPLDVNKKRRVPFEAVLAATDPVALDVVGWQIVEQLRKDNGLPSLKDAGREPSYIRAAGELGLGVFDPNQVRLRQVRV